MRTGLRLILERDQRFVVVGEAAAAEPAAALVPLRRPDVVVLDLSLPDRSGVTLISELRELPEPPRVLVLSNYDDDELVEHALGEGAAGYLLKGASIEEFTGAIWHVAAGRAALSPSVAGKVLAGYRGAREPAPHESLSPRERAVFDLLACGLSNQEIAERLHISHRTAGNHVTAIFQKLNLNRRAEAVLYAARHGLTPPAADGAPAARAHRRLPAAVATRPVGTPPALPHLPRVARGQRRMDDTLSRSA